VDLYWLFFGFRGRLARKPFWLALLLILKGLAILSLFGFWLLLNVAWFSLPYALLDVVVVSVAVCSVLVLPLCAKRLQDSDLPGYLALPLLPGPPVLLWWFGATAWGVLRLALFTILVLGILPSSTGDNRFGAPSRE